MERLHRSSSNKVIAGVAGGLAETFGVSAKIIRTAFVLLTLLGVAPGVVIYIILWIIMPKAAVTA